MKRYFAVSTADQLPQVFRAISSDIEPTDTDGDDIPDIIDAIDLYPLTQELNPNPASWKLDVTSRLVQFSVRPGSAEVA